MGSGIGGGLGGSIVVMKVLVSWGCAIEKVVLDSGWTRCSKLVPND